MNLSYPKYLTRSRIVALLSNSLVAMPSILSVSFFNPWYQNPLRFFFFLLWNAFEEGTLPCRLNCVYTMMFILIAIVLFQWSTSMLIGLHVSIFNNRYKLFLPSAVVFILCEDSPTPPNAQTQPYAYIPRF